MLKLIVETFIMQAVAIITGASYVSCSLPLSKPLNINLAWTIYSILKL